MKTVPLETVMIHLHLFPFIIEFSVSNEHYRYLLQFY